MRKPKGDAAALDFAAKILVSTISLLAILMGYDEVSLVVRSFHIWERITPA
jgi:hypothetical protein